jgi:prolyl-tRNA synthetase
MKTAISPTRKENYPEWYQSLLKAADLAENSPVRGCMVIKPWGYAIWENIQKHLDRLFKEKGVQNGYFPLFIPLSYFEKEAAHIEGFAKECAVVTHHRLEMKGGKLVPAGELEEPLIVRPTSEMIIGESFSRWIESYRDLPVLINQWANVVRWEMRTRMFLRTTEFLWQEGHTAHANEQEAETFAKEMLHLYASFGQDKLAIPFVTGEKTAHERFPGAVHTYTIEGLMQDGKALQCGTSHFLGQNFSKASNIVYASESGERVHAWTTSWGVTTRLIGALIMTHSDDDGLVLPPEIAPAQVVILPILHSEETKASVLAYAKALEKELKAAGIETLLDARDIRGGEKAWSWIKKGIPIRIEVGAREKEADRFSLLRRDRPHKEVEAVPRGAAVSTVRERLCQIQAHLLAKATAFRRSNTVPIDSKEAFYDFFKGEKGGFAFAHWNGKTQVEEKIKEELGVTIRCLPDGEEKEAGRCPFTGEESKQRVLFAKAY